MMIISEKSEKMDSAEIEDNRDEHKQPQDHSNRSLNISRNFSVGADAGMAERQEECNKLSKLALEGIDVRVPRVKDELGWRVAFFLRHRTNLIQKEE